MQGPCRPDGFKCLLRAGEAPIRPESPDHSWQRNPCPGSRFRAEGIRQAAMRRRRVREAPGVEEIFGRLLAMVETRPRSSPGLPARIRRCNQTAQVVCGGLPTVRVGYRRLPCNAGPSLINITFCT